MKVAVIDPYGLIPVINVRRRREAVAGSFGWILIVSAAARKGQTLARVIVKVIFRQPMDRDIIRFPKCPERGVMDQANFPVISGNMVGRKIDENLETCGVGAL